MEIAGSLHCSVVVITRCDLVLKCRDVIILSGIILKLSRAKKHTEAEACGRIRPNARRLRKKRLRKENISFQQYNCNQERIENNQLIGFANARPSTATILQFLRSPNHSKDDINTVSFCHQCEISVYTQI